MRAALLTLGLVAAASLAFAAPAAAAPVPLASIGSTGAGAGQINAPSDVAIDGSGNVYVADTNNNRIDVFSANGAFIHAFGWGVDTGTAAYEVCTTASTCQAGLGGGGPGQLNAPFGLAFDASGNLYVGGQFSHRIDVFNPAGPSFVHAFGWDVAPPNGDSAFEVCTTASGCLTGDQGGEAGQFSYPLGVVLDGSGNLYVANSGNNRIDVFNTSGPSFTRAFGWGVNTGAGSFEVCTTASTCQQGIAGGGGGQLNIPYAVALDGSGNLYTVDDADHRVSVYNTAGPSFSEAFGWGVDTGASTFQVCTQATICQEGVSGGGAGQLAVAFGIAVDGAGNLLVGAGVNNRIDVFDPTGPSFTRAFGWGVDTSAAAFEVCTTASTCQQGLPSSGVGQLNGPVGVKGDCRGAVWVADLGNNRVQRFGEPGTPPPPCTSTPPPSGGGSTGGTTDAGGTTTPAAGPTGQRAAALAKCKKKHGKARKKCRKRANRLPV
jgi:DNA-binding beta-propeller fold protein YncE